MSTTSVPLPFAPVPDEVPRDAIVVERSSTERPLFVLALLISLVFWVVICISVVGLVYAVCLGAFFFVLHLGFVAHLRGSAVRLAPDQLPELHARVELLARRMGMARAPEAYVMQAGGSLNAFATRFLRANLIVLFAELLDACGDDDAARDMIIAHELGHIHAGHLRWHWLLLPAGFIPFLGTALSRAREYTCDRYGLAGAGSTAGAVRGLTILAAGPRQAARVNLAAFARQRAQLNTGWMTIGEWLSTHPPLVKRVARLDPSLAVAGSGTAGVLRALGILLLIVSPLVAGGALVATRLPAWLAAIQATTPPEAGDVPEEFGAP